MRVPNWTHSRQSSISYRTRASFHMLRAKLHSYDGYPLVARAFFFRIRNDRLLDSTGLHFEKFGNVTQDIGWKILCLPSTRTARFSHWLRHQPPTREIRPRTPPTYHTYLPTARGKKRGDSFGRKQSRPTSSRFVSTFHVKWNVESNVRIVGPPYAIGNLWEDRAEDGEEDKDKANRTKSRKRRSTRCERRGNDVKPWSRQHRWIADIIKMAI